MTSICRNCGDDFSAPERACPSPSPGIPNVNCGRGGHWFVDQKPPGAPERDVEAMFDRLLQDMLLMHPMPWRIEHDWSVEVIDANGVRISAGRHQLSAEALIAEAARVHARSLVMFTRIGFTGTRYGMRESQHSEVQFLMAMFTGFACHDHAKFFAHHGDCVGADAEFHEIARRCGATIEIHPGPAYDVARQAGCVGDLRHPPKLHMIRNRDIVRASEVMIAAPMETTEQVRGGTWRTIEMTRNAKKPLLLVWPNGNVSKERWP